MTEKPRGMFWKEWRARIWLLAALCLVLLGAALLDWQSPFDGKEISLLAVPWLAWALLVDAVLLGINLFALEEHDPSRAFLYTLPLSRGRILRGKLFAVLLQYLLLSAIGIALVFATGQVKFPIDLSDIKSAGLLFTLLAIAAGVPILLMAALLAFHVRSAVLALIFGVLFGGALLLLMAFGTLLIPGMKFMDDPVASQFPIRCLVATVLLAGWFFYLLARTPLQELGPTARSLYALLFGIASIEIFFTIFLANWRELLFAIFGV